MGRCVSYEGPVVDRCIGRGLVPCPVPDHDGVCQRYVRTDNLEFAYAVELDPGGLMYAAAVRGGRRRVAPGRVRHHGHVSPGSAYIGWEQYVSNEACKSSDRSGTNVISANYWRSGLCFDDVRAQCKEPVGSSPAVQIQSWLTGGNTCPGNPASFHTVVDTCTAPGTTGDTRVLTCGYNTPGRFRTVRVQDGEQCSASQPAVAVYQEAGPLCNTQQCLTSAGYALNVTCSTDKTFPDTNGLEVVLRTYGPDNDHCSGQ